ncbi:hypothetical protein Taro_053540 [Colocasia esculenta]|uniref:Pentatricopeptide repeat-containing protein n=1 Tax=Colocasia esculenta TaxID=4460 RepID=A0A843XL99_COLES|nr:hypothetical protein [Colocasia esculenta]
MRGGFFLHWNLTLSVYSIIHRSRSPGLGLGWAHSPLNRRQSQSPTPQPRGPPRAPNLYDFSNICSATNFLGEHLSSSTSNSWRCTLRGKDAVVFQRRFRGDRTALRRRLAAPSKIQHNSIVRLLGAALGGGDYIYLEYVPAASLADCLRNPMNAWGAGDVLADGKEPHVTLLIQFLASATGPGDLLCWCFCRTPEGGGEGANQNCLIYKGGLRDMHLQKQIVSMLRLGVKDKASQMLLNFQNYPSILRAEDFLHILDYCARAPDPLFVVETWRIMNEKAVRIDKRCWTFIIQALSDGGYLKEAFNQLAFLGENDSTRSCLPLYNIFLNGCVKSHNLTHANNCLNLMDEQLVGKSEITYWELLKLAVAQENISLAHEIWRDFRKYYNPSIISLRKFIWSFVRLGDLQSAYLILQHTVSMMVQGYDSLTISSKGRFFSSRLDIPIPLITDLPDGLPRNLTFCSAASSHGIGNEYAIDIGLAAFNTEMMEEKDMKIDVRTDTPSAIMKKILRWSFSDLIHAYAQCEKYEMAERLFVQDQPERAIRILAKMKQSSIRPNIRTFELLFTLFGNVNAPYEEGNILSHAEVRKRIQALESDMSRYGVQHSFVSLENLIRALGSEGMIKEVLQYLHLAESLFLHPQSYPRTSIYNSVLHSLVEARESHMAVEVFRNMIAGDFPPDSTTYNIMIDCCTILRCFNSACALVSMMLRSGYHPQRITYTALIKVLLANEDFDAALRLVEQSISERMQSDVLLYNTVLLEADKKGRIDVIEYVVEQMHQQKIQPDPATCNYVFSAYVNHDFYNTAIEALQVLSMRMISEDENILLEKRIVFEDLVHSEDPDVESWITDIFKEVDEHLAAALLNLRWCAIAGYSISWSPKQTLWSRRLSSCYGSIK